MATPSFTQVTFRIRNDDGSETAATWKANENTSATIATGNNFRVRFRIDEGNSSAWTSVTWNLYYSKNGGAYAAVSGTTPVQFSLSSNYADGEDCTTQLSGGTGTFVTDNNGMKETTGGATNSGTKNYLFELEWCLKLDAAQLAQGNTIDLQVYNGTSAIAAYTNTPRITTSLTVACTATNIASDVPAVTKPTAGAVGAFVSKAIASGVPALTKSTLAGKAALTSKAIASGIPAVTKSTAAVSVALTSQNIASGVPAVSKSTLVGVAVLVSKAVASGIPAVVKPTLAGVAALVSKAIASGIPTLANSTIQQIVALVSKPVASDVPVIVKSTASVESQAEEVALTTQNISTTPAVSKATISQKVALVAKNIEASTVIDTARIAQVHALVAFAIAAGIPIVIPAELFSIGRYTSPTKIVIVAPMRKNATVSARVNAESVFNQRQPQKRQNAIAPQVKNGNSHR